MPYGDDQKDQVQHATDIVRLIGEQITLRPKGREFVGLCPFHDDRNPSLQVSPQKQIYKCFSCGAGGDAFSFVMNYHKMTFPEALRHLADRAGIELRRDQGSGTRDQGETSSQRQSIAQANAQALEFFRVMLKHAEHGRVARTYVEQREIGSEMQGQFQIGYAPDRWDGLVQMIESKGWNRHAFEQAGLVHPRNEGGHYDRLRHRLIFPIFDAIGRPIAFGGRVLPESTRDDSSDAKYLNTHETPLFNKSRTLYGLHLAKKPIIDSRVAVLVEGYTDVIACHQAGYVNVVATLGTALTNEHATELRRFADKVVLVFDADEAGQKAADRAVEVFLTGELDVAITVLPDGQDPAELLADPQGADQWQRLIDDAEDALGYQFRRFREQLDAQPTVTGREKAAGAYVARVAQLGLARTGAIRRSWFIQRLAGLLRMSEGTVHQMIRSASASRRPIRTPAPILAGAGEPQPDDPHDRHNPQSEVAQTSVGNRLKSVEAAERQVIGALLHRNEMFRLILADGLGLDEALTPEQMISEPGRRLYRRLYDRLAQDHAVTPKGLLGELASHGEQDLANLLTSCEHELEQMALGQDERIEEILTAAATALLRHHREADYLRTRKALTDPSARGDADGDKSEDTAQLLQRLIEDRKANPSPTRILGRTADAPDR